MWRIESYFGTDLIDPTDGIAFYSLVTKVAVRVRMNVAIGMTIQFPFKRTREMFFTKEKIHD